MPIETRPPRTEPTGSVPELYANRSTVRHGDRLRAVGPLDGVAEQVLRTAADDLAELSFDQRELLGRWLRTGLRVLLDPRADESAAADLLARQGAESAHLGAPLETLERVTWTMISTVMSMMWASVAPGDAGRATALGERATRIRALMSRTVIDAYCASVTPDTARRDRSRVALALVRGAKWSELAARCGVEVPARMVVLVSQVGSEVSRRSSDPEADHLACDHDGYRILLVAVPSSDSGRPADELVPDAHRPWGAARADGPDQVWGAVAEAIEARRAAVICSVGLHRAAVVASDVAVEVAMVGDPALAGRLTGPLAELRSHAQLVETLRAYVASDLDQTRTASVLGLHRRSLAYRLARIAQLTGTDPRSARGVQIFSTALAAREALRTTEGSSTEIRPAPAVRAGTRVAV